MQVRRRLVRPTLLLLAIGAVAIAILLLPSRGDSIDWGHGEWVVSSFAQSHQATCAQADPNGRCKEWCELNGGQLEGTGMLCCVIGNGPCYAHNVFYP